MAAGDHRRTTTRRPGRAIIASVALALMLAASGVALAAGTGAAVTRCGYARTEYGRSGIYPWHMSCADATRVAVASGNQHVQQSGIDFGPGWDGGAVKINGSYWVCTGQMGGYSCGYPYRPVTVHGEQGYKGPFTKDVQFSTCRLVPCPAHSTFIQPSA